MASLYSRMKLLPLRRTPFIAFKAPPSWYPSVRRPLPSLSSSPVNDYIPRIPILKSQRQIVSVKHLSILQEDEYHMLANTTIHVILDKLENEVLALKLGSLGTYVINKQTPNRQIWMASPVSSPSRFDWDQNSETWVYRRTKANLLQVLESELEKLCGTGITLT